ncbi:MAG: histidinol-phosphate transaminase [Desulfocapsaceae bacterium]|nr:histidinol-phosphate transaminase [Desulfocapsaceae bacterium]
MKIQVPDNIASIIPYPPGKPLEELEREYGVRDSIKMASNENPWGPSPKAIQAIRGALENLHRYPDGSGYYLVHALSEKLGFSAEEIVLGNGSNEIIEMLVKAYVQNGDEVITSHPSFLMYQKIVQVRGGVNIVIPLARMHHDLDTILAVITDKTRLIFLDNPNNPTANPIKPTDLYTFISAVPESVLVVLDEAYVDFMDSELQVDIFSLIRNSKGRCGVVSLRTFSKAYGLAGLRIGYGLMPSQVAVNLHKVRQPFNVNQLAQIGALAALEDEEFYQQTLRRTREGLNYLQDEVEKLGCKSYPSQTNFFLIDVKGDATVLYEAMLHKGVIVRSMKPYGYTDMVRITVGNEEENNRFLAALSACLLELSYV